MVGLRFIMRLKPLSNFSNLLLIIVRVVKSSKLRPMDRYSITIAISVAYFIGYLLNLLLLKDSIIELNLKPNFQLIN